MTTTKLQDKTDTGDWRDRIEGLVRLPDDHVYGATALTQDDWRRLAHKRRTDEFVVLLDMPHMSRRADSLPQSWEYAMGNFRFGIEAHPDTYQPHSQARLLVMAEAEWKRLCRETGR